MLPQKPAFYALNCSGVYGFAFVDFGTKLTYLQGGNSEQPAEEFTVDSVSLGNFLDKFCSGDKLKWSRREASNS